jgi:hypothetical protein
MPKQPRTTTLGALLRVAPSCLAVNCTRPAVVRVTLTKPTWRKPERATLCKRHRESFIAGARKLDGVTITTEEL